MRRRHLFSYLLKRGCHPSDIEDIGQEIYIAAWNRGEMPVDSERWGGWIVGVARHKLIDYKRARGYLKNRYFLKASMLNDGIPHPTMHMPDEICISNEVCRHIDETITLLAKCGIHQKSLKMFRLSLEGMKTKEIAHSLGVQVRNVERRLQNIRERLKEGALGKLLEE